MNMTSFLQDKRLTIALKGEIDHHSAKDTMRIIGNKIDIYLRHRDCHSRHPAHARAAGRGAGGKRTAAADEGIEGVRNGAHCGD